MKFVFYKKTPMGKWSIQTSSERPEKRTAEGVKPKITGIQVIDPKHEDLPLKILEDLYPVPEGM